MKRSTPDKTSVKNEGTVKFVKGINASTFSSITEKYAGPL